MKRLLGVAAAAAVTFLGTAAMAQPYGYYGRGYYRDSDRDGIPDRDEWGHDRDHDGRPDQWDRYDNRRERHHRHGYNRYYNNGYSYGYSYPYGYSYGY